jgi:hypothetical protein
VKIGGTKNLFSLECCVWCLNYFYYSLIKSVTKIYSQHSFSWSTTWAHGPWTISLRNYNLGRSDSKSNHSKSEESRVLLLQLRCWRNMSTFHILHVYVIDVCIVNCRCRTVVSEESVVSIYKFASLIFNSFILHPWFCSWTCPNHFWCWLKRISAFQFEVSGPLHCHTANCTHFSVFQFSVVEVHHSCMLLHPFWFC